MIKSILKGLATYTPLYRSVGGGRTGGTNSARYCYSVWFRHLLHAVEKGGMDPVPEVIAELGPGDSLGTGLAGLLSGAREYHAFDIVTFSNPARNLELFGELIDLFRNREPIPGEDEFPNVAPKLGSYIFPSEILPDSLLERTLEPSRLEAVREQIATTGAAENDFGIRVQYTVPWDEGQIRSDSVDFLFSQAVLEHVRDLDRTCAAINRWLVPGGFCSHTIDLRSHNLVRSWDGHWAIPPFWWRLIYGRREYLLNRLPVSSHEQAHEMHGLEIRYALRRTMEPVITPEKLASSHRWLSDEDRQTAGVYLLARKRNT